MSHSFEKGDSNRCRNVYEQILRAGLPPGLLDAHKKNKHVSVGRCRMLAINHRVALPAYEALSRAGFVEACVPQEQWSVPTDCKRFLKKLGEEGLCRGHCHTCDQLTGPPQPQVTSRQQAARSARRGPPPLHSVPIGADGLDGLGAEGPAASHSDLQVSEPLIALQDLEDCMTSALRDGEHQLLLEHGALLQDTAVLNEGAALLSDPHLLLDGVLLESAILEREMDATSAVLAPLAPSSVPTPEAAHIFTAAHAARAVSAAHASLHSSVGCSAAPRDDSWGGSWSEDGVSDSSDTEPLTCSPSLGAQSPLADVVSPRTASTHAAADDVRRAAGAEGAGTVPPSADTLERVYRQVRTLRTHLASSRALALHRPAGFSLKRSHEHAEAFLHGGGAAEAETKRRCRELLARAAEELQQASDELELMRHDFRSGANLLRGGGGDACSVPDGPTTALLRGRGARALRLLKKRCAAACAELAARCELRIPSPPLLLGLAQAPDADTDTDRGDDIDDANDDDDRWEEAEIFDGGAEPCAAAAAGDGPINRCTLPDGRRALVLFCSATVAPLDCSAEAEALQAVGFLPAACAPLKGGSFEQLRRALREFQPHIFWFAGHGDATLADGESTLGFSGADGSLQLLDPVVLANELRAHLHLRGGSLECAVLNACCTGGAAGKPRASGGLGSLGDLLHQCGMPAVLCWRSRAHNEASAHFARGLGAALVRGDTYTAAFAQGEREICAQLERHATSVGGGGGNNGGSAAILVQKFELIDPLDGRVAQPDDVAVGRAEPRQLYRVRAGVGQGRVAAGTPCLLSHLAHDVRCRSPPHGGGAAAASANADAAAAAMATTERLAPLGTRPRAGQLWLLLGLVALVAGLLLSSPELATSELPRLQRLASVDNAGLLRLEPAAVKALRALPGPVCAVAVVGPAREGSSTLANALQAHLHRATLGAASGAAPGAVAGAAPGAAPGTRALGAPAAAAPPPFRTRHGAAMAEDEDEPRPAVWMWAAPLAPPSAAMAAAPAVASIAAGAGLEGCASVAVFDAEGIGRGAGSLRVVSWLSLVAARIVLNVRRQPSAAILEHVAHAAAAAEPLRPTSHDATAGGSGPAPPAVATAALPPPHLPAVAPSEAHVALEARRQALQSARFGLSQARPTAAPGLPSIGSGLPGLTVLLRDASLQLKLHGAPLDGGQALSHWLDGDAARLAALRAAFGAPQLLQLGAPTELDLELLARGAAPASAFGGALAAVAAAIVAGVAPPAAGTNLGEWAALAAAWLNRE